MQARYCDRYRRIWVSYNSKMRMLQLVLFPLDIAADYNILTRRNAQLVTRVRIDATMSMEDRARAEAKNEQRNRDNLAVVEKLINGALSVG